MLAFLSFLPSFPNLSFHPLLPSFPCLSLPFLTFPNLSLPFLSYRYLIQFLSILTFSAIVPTGTYRSYSIHLIPPRTTPAAAAAAARTMGTRSLHASKTKKKKQNKNKEVSYRHDYEESEYQDAPHGIYYCAQWRSWGTKST